MQDNLFQLEIKIVFERKVNCMAIVSVIIKKKFDFSSNTHVSLSKKALGFVSSKIKDTKS